MYNYWAYGLLLQSEVFFPELMPAACVDQTDLYVRLGPIPIIETQENDFVTEHLIITPTAYKLVVQGTATYYAEGGKTILIDSFPGHDPDTLRLFCLSNVFAAILHQRKTIPLHCAAIVYREQLVLFFGASGAGKSTLLAALMKRGYAPFSDDVCVPLMDSAGTVQCYSSYPMIKYWKNEFELPNANGLGQGHQLRPGIEKFGYYFHDRFSTDPQKPFLAFFLEKAMLSKAVKIEPSTGMELFVRLDAQAYRSSHLPFSGLQVEHFQLFTTLSNQLKAFVVSRQEDTSTVQLLTDLVEDKIKTSF